ncbi:MAG: hypothetical protein ACFFDY_03650, partial [Candidatus Thorarchaeota archaeon]
MSKNKRFHKFKLINIIENNSFYRNLNYIYYLRFTLFRIIMALNNTDDQSTKKTSFSDKLKK